MGATKKKVATFRVDEPLWEAFKAWCEQAGYPPGTIIRHVVESTALEYAQSQWDNADAVPGPETLLLRIKRLYEDSHKLDELDYPPKPHAEAWYKRPYPVRT